MKSTVDLLAEVIDDMGETLAYAVLSPKIEEELLKAMAKLKLVHSRLANPVVQQETKRHIPKDPYKKTSTATQVISYIKAGKLPPLDLGNDFGIDTIGKVK